MPTPHEKIILELLAEELLMNGPPGIMDVSAVVAAVQLAPSEAWNTILHPAVLVSKKLP